MKEHDLEGPRMRSTILVVAEHRSGELKKTTWEAIGFGRKLAHQLGKSVSAIVLGDSASELAFELSHKGGLEVLNVSDPACRDFSPDIYCEILSQIARKELPFLIVMGHTYQAIDYAPKLAAMLGCPFIPNCIDFVVEKGRLVFVRRVFNGKLDLHVGINGSPPYLVSLQPAAFDMVQTQQEQTSRVIDLRIPMPELSLKRKVLQVVQEVDGRVDLSKAEVIVAGGRGLRSKDQFRLVLDLAEALGAEVGATRPVVDAGWLPKGHQIGSSGQQVKPKLYVACGISGEIQHLVGMLNSRCIVAINRDPNAPIFNVADYGIVGDVFTIVPVLTKLAKARWA
jgi:electron transfer flavoprotein alpha subunit